MITDTMNHVGDPMAAGTELDDHQEILERMARLEAKLDKVLRYTENLEHRVEGLSEFKEDVVPIVNDAAKLASHKLMQMEATGTISAASRLAKAVTSPEAVHTADRALAALVAAQSGNAGQPLPGLFKSMRDPEVRRGMAVMMTVLRELGRVEATPLQSTQTTPAIEAAGTTS